MLPAAGGVEFRYAGEAGGIEETLAGRAGIPFGRIATGQIRGRAPWTAARNLLRMRQGARRCREMMREFRPDAVFMTGGYVAVPLAWAARAEGVPLMIYLPDLTPGRAIQYTARYAVKVAVSFPEVAHYFGSKAVVTGYPVREELLSTEKAVARASLGLAGDAPVLLVFGGSRGARSINRAVIAALPALLPKCQVLHITGQTDWAEAHEAVQELILPGELMPRYHAYPYLHEMVQALVAADLAIARAGAATLGEFPAVGLPGILVPYPYAGQHQEANAAYLAERGGALVVQDAELPGSLASSVFSLLDNPDRLQQMSRASRAISRPDAARTIARELTALAELSR